VEAADESTTLARPSEDGEFSSTFESGVTDVAHDRQRPRQMRVDPTEADDARTREGARPRLPLDDLRVVEIGYGVAAPVCCRNLAEFGADVVKVESARRPDSLRVSNAGWAPPTMPWSVRRDTGASINCFTSPQKRSVGLEIEGAGYDPFLRLVARSDVLVMNMSYDSVESLKLRFVDLRAVNPSLIYMNMASFGASEGPYRSYRTWGGNLAALAGITALVGWPDRDPTGMPISFPDYVSALWGSTMVVGALLQRDETGEGCEIDLAQYQVAVHCLGPTVTQALLGGPVARASGNRAPGRAVQGVYDSRDADRWVAISALDDETWEALTGIAGLERLAGDVRYASADGRLEYHDEIDAALNEWTRTRTDWDATAELQRAGVPASPVMDHWDVLGDHQLASRRTFRIAGSARFGADLTYGQAAYLPDTPRRSERAGPAFGEHTREVLGEIGCDDAEIDTFMGAGVAHEMPYEDLHLERPFLHWIPRLMCLPWPAAEVVDPAQIVFDRLAGLDWDAEALE
jgi:benzylsuccinate CoA-transferase BbsF subunit